MINLNRNPIQVDTSWDTVIIEKYIDGIVSGKSLFMDEAEDDGTLLPAGTVIAKSDDGYVAVAPTAKVFELPVDDVVVGVLYKSINPFREGAPIMTRGRVNEKAFENYADITYSDEVKEALNLIEFKID